MTEDKKKPDELCLVVDIEPMTEDELEPDDPWLAATVERTLSLYRPLLPPAALEAMREVLVDALWNDEVGRDLLERARPTQAPLKTGPRANGAATPASADKRGGGRG